MNMKLYTYKRKNTFMLLLLAGILLSMYSCQYDTVPIGTIIPIGASAVIQNNWINMRDCSWQSSLFFIILCLSNKSWRITMNKYDWKNVPKWVNFIATDPNGIAYGYEKRPYIILNSMFVGGNYVNIGSSSCNVYWKNSVEERPNV